MKKILSALMIAIFAAALAGCSRGNNNDSDGGLCPSGMTYIPSGEFTMGCSQGDEDCSDDEKPTVRVNITRAFCIDKTEVTQGAFEKQTNRKTSRFKKCGSDCPAENLFWNDAKLFCERTGKRLPTEAEWEYAARAGTTTKFYWGNTEDERYAWTDTNSKGKTHPVAGKKPNDFGLYDMAGNAYEWVLDTYDSEWYSYMPVLDPANSGSSYGAKVIRGGSALSNAKKSRISARAENDNVIVEIIGFRCAKTIE